MNMKNLEEIISSSSDWSDISDHKSNPSIEKSAYSTAYD